MCRVRVTRATDMCTPRISRPTFVQRPRVRSALSPEPAVGGSIVRFDTLSCRISVYSAVIIVIEYGRFSFFVRVFRKNPTPFQYFRRPFNSFFFFTNDLRDVYRTHSPARAANFRPFVEPKFKTTVIFGSRPVVPEVSGDNPRNNGHDRLVA